MKKGKLQIWVDADACPKVIKEILFRAAKRVRVVIVFVANQSLQIPASPYLKSMQVPGGFNIADDEIVKQVQSGDLVVTADIPLAAAIIEKNATALNPRGKLYTSDNIGEILTMRNLMDELRTSGAEIGGPQQFNPSDRETFANELDQFLQKNSNPN